MKLSAQSYSSILGALKKALGRYQSDTDALFVTDIHLQPLSESGELVVYDDDEQVLARTTVLDWVDCVAEDFYASVELHLKQALEELRKEGTLDRLGIMKPYSFVLIDDDKETVADLLLMDDEETMLLNDELLKGLDEELDAFLKELLEK